MVRRATISVLLVLTIATLGAAAPANAVLPIVVTLNGPSTAEVGVPVVFDGDVTFLGVGLPLLGAEVFVNGQFIGEGATGLMGEYEVPYTFTAPGLYLVHTEVVGTLWTGGTSPTIEVRVGSHSLTVTKAGDGQGTVTSTPAGIDCGSDCTESYAIGTDVDLTATAEPGSIFSGWGGDCTGTGACTLSMTADRSVSATFTDTTPPPVPPAAPILTHTVPSSPANDNQPHVHGTAEPGVDVFLFTNSTCSGLPVGADNANPATGGAFSIQVLVPDDSTTTFYANAVDGAGNESACSNGVTYVEDTP